MSHEQHLAFDLIARMADRFGPASRIHDLSREAEAKEGAHRPIGFGR